jgi:hypothetical protein
MVTGPLRSLPGPLPAMRRAGGSRTRGVIPGRGAGRSRYGQQANRESGRRLELAGRLSHTLRAMSFEPVGDVPARPGLRDCPATVRGWEICQTGLAPRIRRRRFGARPDAGPDLRALRAPFLPRRFVLQCHCQQRGRCHYD